MANLNLEGITKKKLFCTGPSLLSEYIANPDPCPLPMWASHIAKPDKKSSFDLDQYKKTHKEVETFVNPIFQNMLSSAYHYEPDTKKLKCVIKGKTIFVVPDLLATTKEKIFVCDIKTGERKIAEHSLQVGTYAFMALAQGIAQDIGGLYLAYGSKKENLEIIELPNIEDIWTLERQVKAEELMDLLEEEDEPIPNPSENNCRYCKWSNRCNVAHKSTKTVEMFSVLKK